MLLLSLSALLALFSAGCVQTSAPPQCADNASQPEAEQCTYKAAVMEQNPFYCYSISDPELRSDCMKHASDPAMKKRLERLTPQPAQPQQPQRPADEPPPSPPQDGNESACSNLTGIPRDECLLEAASSQDDLAGCMLVSDVSARQVCISRVAQSTKDLAACDTISDASDAEVCRAYASGN